jgi:hypothetical protein
MEMVQTTRGRKSQISFWEAEDEVKYFLAKHKNFLTKNICAKVISNQFNKKYDIFYRNDLLLVSILP